MKIQLTTTQYQAVRSALIVASIALESMTEDIREQNSYMYDFRMKQVNEVKAALDATSWSEVSVGQ